MAHRQIHTTPEKWIVVRNTHEPIVNRELFERVQVIRAQAGAKYIQAEKKSYTENVLRGRVFCGCCGKNLNRQKSHGRYFYRCITNDRIGEGSCSSNIRYFLERDLFETIVDIIRQKAEVVMGNDLRLKQEDSRIAMQKAEANQEIAQLRRETERNRTLLAGLYENFVVGILTRAEYLELKEDYSNKISAAVERVQQLQEQEKMMERQLRDYTSLADRLATVDKDATLSSRLVSELIERVIVNSPKDVTIRFRFENGFDQLLGVLADG